jgi:hypothetical protein
VKGTQLLLGCLGLVVSAIGVAVPAYIAYDLYGTGPSAERRLELERGIKLNPIGAFSDFAGKAQVSIAFEGRPLRNLFVERDILRNTGRVPILPSDYVEKLTVSTQTPWTILDVDGSLKPPGNVVLHWKRKSDTSFEAEPALLNPGDTVSTDIYLTSLQDVSGSDVKQTLEPAAKWDTRIVNLRAISPPQRRLLIMATIVFSRFSCFSKARAYSSLSSPQCCLRRCISFFWFVPAFYKPLTLWASCCYYALVC